MTSKKEMLVILNKVAAVFGKEIDLIKRFEEKSEMVPLYIKFNKIEDKFLIVVSFHKQKYPLVYYFQ